MFQGIAGRWALATGVGFGLAFLSFIPVGELFGLFASEAVTSVDRTMVPEHLDPDALPAWLDRATYEELYRFMLGQHVVMYAIFGFIVGSLQWYALREALPRALPWVFVTMAGFMLILTLEIVKRHAVIGPHAGPLEPIMIALGGGSLAGGFQWFYLRRQGTDATKWLLLWIVGIVLGIAAAAATLTVVDVVLRPGLERVLTPEALEEVGLVLFFAVYGSVVGGVAGLVSGRRMSATLPVAVKSPEVGSE